MGLMVSNEIRSRSASKIRREWEARAVAAGVDPKDRPAIRRWMHADSLRALAEIEENYK